MRKSKVNDAVETIIMHKAEKMKKSGKLTEHIEDFLSERGIDVKKDPAKVFQVCAVDAMIYDVGAALDFTAQRGSGDDWTSYPNRKYILRKIFPKRISGKDHTS